MSNNFKQTMKLFTSVALCISMLLGAFILPAAAENDFTVEVGSVTAFPGETVSIPLTFANNADVAALILTPDVDEGLTIDDVTLEGSLFDAVTVGLNLMFDGDPEAAIHPASGTFAVLTVTVADDCAAGTYDLSVIVRECVDSWYEEVACTVVPGTVTVVTATPTKAAASAGHDAYSLDGENWQTSPVFTGLYPSTEYTVSVKDGETVTTETVTTADPESYTKGEYIDAAAEQISVKIAYNVGLHNNIELNYFVQTAALEGFENVRMYLQKENYADETDTCTLESVVLTDYTETTLMGRDCYKFNYKGLKSWQMGSNVYATIYAELDGVTYISQLDVYGIKTYAANTLATTTDASLKTLLVDTLNYGAASQIYFQKNTSNLVNAFLTADQQALATAADVTPTTVSGSVKLEGATAAFKGASLVLGNEIELKYYFTVPTGVDIDDVTIVLEYTGINGTPKTAVLTSADFTAEAAYDTAAVAGYSVKYANLFAYELGLTVDATVQINGTAASNTVHYSGETYAANQLAKTTTAQTLADLINALLKYSRSARAYFEIEV